MKLMYKSILAVSLVAGAAGLVAWAEPEKEQPRAPEKPVTSTPVKVGEPAPDFTLKDTEGKEVKLSEVGKDKIVVLEWFNANCPFVKRVHVSSDVMVKMQGEYKDKGVVWLAVCSSGTGKDGSGVEFNAKAKKDYKMEYPILLDEPGTVGRAYGAKTTPHMYIIGKDGKLAYKGGVDNGTPDKIGEKNWVKNALDEIIAGKKVTEAETKNTGCGVKYGK